MDEPEKFILSVATNEGSTDVVAYLPFIGAEFCIHRHVTIGLLWVVSHVRSRLKVPVGDFETKDEAFAMAKRLSEECPSAKLVEWTGESDGISGIVTGPRAELAREVKAVMGEAA